MPDQLVIHKYRLPFKSGLVDVVEVPVRVGRLLHVALQHGEIHAWAAVRLGLAVTTLVKRGTARRLGLRPWSSHHQIPLSYVQMPDGSRYKLVCAGSKARTTFVDERGSAVHDVPIALNVGAGAALTRWGPVRTGRSSLPGDTKEVQSVDTDDVRDWMTQADPANAGLIMSRDQVVNQWCKEHGKDKDHLTFADIAAIRALPQWINAG